MGGTSSGSIQWQLETHLRSTRIDRLELDTQILREVIRRSGCSCMGSMRLPTDFTRMQSGKKEGQTYILWAHEGRMDKGARRIIHVNRRIMKTDAVEPKGKERSTEVEIDGQTSKTETVKLALQEEGVYLRAGVYITIPVLERTTSDAFIFSLQTHMCTQPHINEHFPFLEKKKKGYGIINSNYIWKFYK